MATRPDRRRFSHDRPDFSTSELPHLLDRNGDDPPGLASRDEPECGLPRRTTMTTKNAHDLILRIARAFVAHPLDLQLTSQESRDGAIYWALECNPEDEPKLIGRAGSHVDAIRYLVTQMGRANVATWTFRLVTTGASCEREKQAQIVATNYDPTEAKNLLMEILCQLEIGGFEVACDNGDGKRTMLAYRFAIWLENPTDRGVLTMRRPFKHGEGDTMSTLDALGTLYRVIGKTAGVKIKIVIDES